MRITHLLCSAILLMAALPAAQAQAQQQAQAQAQQAQQATAAQLDGFRKAFSACMEGKQYIAKF